MSRVVSRGSKLVIPCLLAAAGCGRLLDTRNPSRRSDAMVLLDGAREVTYYRNHEANGREELEGISYLVDAEFPAERVICQVTAALARSGWRPLRRIRDDRATPSSFLQGWDVIISRRGSSDEHHIDSWTAEWMNSDGDVLSYSLAYRYPSRGAPNRTRMRIGGLREPARRISPSDRERIRQGGEIPAGQAPHLTPVTAATCR
jgi:hypothetical protein